MTTAHPATPIERVAGRAWTVRLTGYADRSATVACSNTACKMPARSKDLAALRRFAAQHAAAHAKAANPRPNAWCHCGSTGCEAHPDTRTQCAGAVTLILRHDPTVGRVWNVEEVCAACAPLLAHTTAVARAARPGRASAQPPAPAPAARPGVPGGFSSPAAGPEDRPAAPARRSRRAAQRPQRRSSGRQR
ncbi:hypothetical protein [Streptomyces collinus]|uniref:hypothetical protein n=1 Tax=Streptomyces collinus TaxID=42684 RepID=UPI00294333A9|nr:hypothetical protein [Streptomyces collinus]